MESDEDDFDTDEGEIEDDSSLNNSAASNSDDLRGLVGLQNLGNTCYMNGALQALSNCQQLTRFVLDCPGLVKENGLSRSYSELIKEIWNSKNPQYAVPASIIRNIKCIYPAFRGCTQQDTQEFLRCFLEQLHDELKQPILERKKDDDEEEEKEPTASAETTTDESEGEDTNTKAKPKTKPTKLHNDSNQRSIISDTFEFNISSSVVCSSCNNISTTKETFKDLSIPIPSRDHPYYQAYNDNIDSQPSGSRDSQEPSFSETSSPTTTSTNAEPPRPTTSPSTKETNSLNSEFSDSVEPTSSSTNLIDNNDKQQEEQNESDNSGNITGRELIQRSYFDSIPLARWFINWFSQLGSWFWGPQVTLYDCLSIFFGTDPLEGDNEYSCEICTKKNKGVKYLKILELPEVLCIHFKRYESIGSAKITTHVSFPLTGLDLAPFMSENSRPQCTTYNLIACICHHGSALLTGHYTTYALNCYDDQWYEFDDQYVTNVSSYEVENSEAYILFYQKSTLDDTTDRQRVRASKLLRRTLNEDNIKKYFISKQWVSKFNTFVEPGPITNDDFLCEHGKVPIGRQSFVSELCHPIKENVWKYLKKLHGGGPECCELITCDLCE